MIAHPTARLVSLFALLLTAPFLASAFPTGAGTCDVTQMSAGDHGTSLQSGAGGYKLTSTAQGSNFQISISGPKAVKGVLLYTQDGTGTRFGNFQLPSGFQAKACTGSGTNTITHTSDALKNMPLNFMWNPAGKTAKTTVRAIVVQDFKDWLMLQDMTFDLTTGAASNGTSSSGSGQTSLPDSGTTTPPPTTTTPTGFVGFFKNNMLFIAMMGITTVLYVIGSVVETLLRRQQVKARSFAKTVGGFGTAK